MINPEYNFPHYVTFDCIMNAIEDLGTYKFILFKINNKLQYCRTNCLALLRLIFISLAQWKLIISFIEPNEIQFFVKRYSMNDGLKRPTILFFCAKDKI